MKKLIKLSIWFAKESKRYISPFKLKDYIYYPVAYAKFIKLSWND